MLYYIIFIKYKYICIIHFILLKLNYINLENPWSLNFYKSQLIIYTSYFYITSDGKFSLPCLWCVISYTVFFPKGNTYLIQFLDKNDLSPLFALKGFYFFLFKHWILKEKIKAQGIAVQLLWHKSIFKMHNSDFSSSKVGILCA